MPGPSSRGICLLVGLALLTSCGAGGKAEDPAADKAKAKGRPPAPVVVAPVVAGPLARTLTGIGQLIPSSTVTLRPQVTGILQTVDFTEGAEIAAGQLLFTIDPRPAQDVLRQAQAVAQRSRAALPQAEAVLRRDEALLANAEAQHQRYLALQDQRVISEDAAAQIATNVQSLQATLLADRAAIITAQAAIAVDEAAVASATTLLEHCRITAPIAGRAGLVGVTAGNLVTANVTALATIAQVQPLHVLWTLPESSLRDIRAAQGRKPLIVTVGPARTDGQPGGWSAQGTLEVIDNTVDTATGTIRLRATLANADGRLWPGQPVVVRLKLGADDQALTVPDEAVQYGQKGSYVYVVTDQQVAELHPVQVVRSEAGRTMLASGVAAGDQVVVDGHLRVAPGLPVTITTPPAPGERTGRPAGAGKAGDNAGSPAAPTAPAASETPTRPGTP